MKKDYDIMRYYSSNLYSSELPDDRDVSLKKLIKTEQNNILPAPYFFVFYDHQLSELLYASPYIEKLYGISPQTIYDDNQHLLFEIIWEDEKLAVIEFVKSIWNDHYQCGKKYVSDRVFTTEYRIKTLKGDVLHMMHQNEVLTFTANELPKMVIARFIDMSWLFRKEKERIVKLYVYNRHTNEIEQYSEKKISQTPAIYFTPREEEVLELINYGFTSNQISEELDISVETVKTHRKNIKAKQQHA